MPGSPLTIRSSSCNTMHSVPMAASASSKRRSPVCQCESSSFLRSERQLHRRVEARAARAFAERFSRDRNASERERDRSVFAARIDRHDHGRRTAHPSPLRDPGRVRGRPRVRKDVRRTRSCTLTRRTPRPSRIAQSRADRNRSLPDEEPALVRSSDRSPVRRCTRATLYRSLQRPRCVESWLPPSPRPLDHPRVACTCLPKGHGFLRLCILRKNAAARDLRDVCRLEVDLQGEAIHQSREFDTLVIEAAHELRELLL